MHEKGPVAGAVLIAIVLTMFVMPAYSQTSNDKGPNNGPSKDEVSALKKMITEQQKQIEALQAGLNAMKQRLDQAPSSAQSAPAQSSSVAEVASATPMVPTNTKSKDALPVLVTSPSGGAALAGAATPAPEEGPAAIRYKGITITPVGFMAAETVWRDHALSADVN